MVDMGRQRLFSCHCFTVSFLPDIVRWASNPIAHGLCRPVGGERRHCISPHHYTGSVCGQFPCSKRCYLCAIHSHSRLRCPQVHDAVVFWQTTASGQCCHRPKGPGNVQSEHICWRFCRRILNYLSAVCCIIEYEFARYQGPHCHVCGFCFLFRT